MACYSIRWKHSARKELKRLDRLAIERIIAAVQALAEEPCPAGCRKLQGTEHLWRIRVGDYRVIYSIEQGELSIEVIRVAHRPSIYKK
jgi:mRNA interferase RelE/StbE